MRCRRLGLTSEAAKEKLAIFGHKLEEKKGSDCTTSKGNYRFNPEIYC